MTVFTLLAASYFVSLFIPPWVSWHHEVLTFLGIYGLVLGAMWHRARQTPAHMMEVPSGVVVMLGLALLVVAQAVGGMIAFTGDALNLLLYLALAVIGWSLGFGLGREQSVAPLSSSLPWVAMLVLGIALASAVLAMVQVFDIWEGAGWVSRMPSLRRPGANLGQPNQLGTLLLMGMASLAYLYECRKLSVQTVWLLFGVVAIGLAATESRTGLLSLLVLGVWWTWGRRHFCNRWSVAIGWLSVMAACTLFWAWPKLMAEASYFEPGASVSTGDSLRLTLWAQLLEAIWQRPWMGWGLLEVVEAQNSIAHGHALSAPLTYAHNIVLDMAIGMGIPLTVLLLALSAVWLWRRVRAVRELHTWYCVAAVLPLAVHSMLEFPFAYAYFLAPTMFLLGVLDGATGGKALGRIGVKTAAAALLLFGAVGAWSVVEYLKIEEDFRIVRFESLRLGKTPADYERPNIVLLTQLGALLEGGRIVPAPGMPPERLELARKVALRFPWPATQHRYALSLALNGEPAEAVRQLRVIRALHGEKTYTEIKSNWQALAQDTYPQLRELTLP